MHENPDTSCRPAALRPVAAPGRGILYAAPCFHERHKRHPL